MYITKRKIIYIKWQPKNWKYALTHLELRSRKRMEIQSSKKCEICNMIIEEKYYASEN